MHSSLRPQNNLALAFAELLGGCALLSFSNPHPIPNLALGVISGVAAGLLQRRAVSAQPNAFLSARTSLEVRAAFAGTPWGRYYLGFFWLQALVSLAVAFALYGGAMQAGLAWIAGYLFFAGCRELAAVPALTQLRRAQPASDSPN